MRIQAVQWQFLRPHYSGTSSPPRRTQTLARTEKKLLNTINHRPYAEGGCRFPVLEAAPAAPAAAAAGDANGGGSAAPPRRVKGRIQTAAEKIQILVGWRG
jgi:hypothetical protein